MADKTELLHLPQSSGSALVRSEAQAGLIARGRKEAALLMARKPVLKVPEAVSEITGHYAEAQFSLGMLYFNGQGVPQDYARAEACFRKAAERGHPTAQDFLGWLYHNGQGIPQDYAQAAYWYRKAAEQGNDDAQNNLGWLYQMGQGVSQDYAQATYWFRKAAEQGNDDAKINLGLVARSPGFEK